MRPEFPSKVPAAKHKELATKDLPSPAAPVRGTALGSNESKDRPKADALMGDWMI